MRTFTQEEMHPAPSLLEAPPKRNDEDRSGPNRTTSPGSGRPDRHTPAESPPLRKDTTSSTSTTLTAASGSTITSGDTSGTSYSVGSSPTFPTQGIFSVKDGADLSSNRGRASRRRTGPLPQDKREKAALIRKMGACLDCRRRRVACDPSHHDMTWEEIKRKYRGPSPSVDFPPLARSLGRALSPARPGTGRPPYTHDPQEMDIDSTPGPVPPQGGRLSMGEAGRLRTPLPSGRSLEKMASAALPPIDASRVDLQSSVSRIVSNPYRSRYNAVSALLLYWENDTEPNVHHVVEELAMVLRDEYNYTFEIYRIPASSDEGKTPFRNLSRKIGELVDERDQRDVLKMVFYNGHSHLDGNREMVLASSANREAAATIRWSGIQQILEDACSDTLILMDAAYYPSARPVRQQGVLELVAAAAAEEHGRVLGRSTFTRALTEQLRARTRQKFFSPLTAAELHANLVAHYPKLIQDRNPESQFITSFPSPLHMQVSASAKLPSVLLAPLSRAQLPFPSDQDPHAPQMSLTIRLNHEAISPETWLEWIRAAPDGIKDIRIDGPFRPPPPAFR